MTVKNITLLSIEEYKQFQSIVPLVKGWWWLRSPGYYQDDAAGVCDDGNIYTGYSAAGGVAVRPALKLSLELSDSLFWYKPEKLIGAKIEYGKYQWTILDAELGELYVLCDKFITERRFDPKSNDWDKSELKQWLETEGLKLITA